MACIHGGHHINGERIQAFIGSIIVIIVSMDKLLKLHIFSNLYIRLICASCLLIDLLFFSEE